jgi:hypothetical protein
VERGVDTVSVAAKDYYDRRMQLLEIEHATKMKHQEDEHHARLENLKNEEERKLCRHNLKVGILQRQFYALSAPVMSANHTSYDYHPYSVNQNPTYP